MHTFHFKYPILHNKKRQKSSPSFFFLDVKILCSLSFNLEIAQAIYRVLVVVQIMQMIYKWCPPIICKLFVVIPLTSR